MLTTWQTPWFILLFCLSFATSWGAQNWLYIRLLWLLLEAIWKLYCFILWTPKSLSVCGPSALVLGCYQYNLSTSNLNKMLCARRHRTRKLQWSILVVFMYVLLILLKYILHFMDIYCFSSWPSIVICLLRLYCSTLFKKYNISCSLLELIYRS